jgi:hypothetical protein
MPQCQGADRPPRKGWPGHPVGGRRDAPRPPTATDFQPVAVTGYGPLFVSSALRLPTPSVVSPHTGLRPTCPWDRPAPAWRSQRRAARSRRRAPAPIVKAHRPSTTRRRASRRARGGTRGSCGRYRRRTGRQERYAGTCRLVKGRRSAPLGPASRPAPMSHSGGLLSVRYREATSRSRTVARNATYGSFAPISAVQPSPQKWTPVHRLSVSTGIRQRPSGQARCAS